MSGLDISQLFHNLIQPMKTHSFGRSFLFSVLLLSTLALTGCAHRQKETALDRYINKPDPAYRYQLVKTLPGQGFTMYVLEMVSQKWLTPEEVNQPEWRHWVTIVKPDKVTSSKALMFISGGGNGDGPPSKTEDFLAKIAVGTESIVAELKMVPNQPLIFKGEKGGRTEDSLIAYTWDKYLRTGDERWPARLPMTKSAVRAMDTITAFCKSNGANVEQFVVSGGSKRGWTTWTTAATDKRVIAIVPFVIDLLNIQPSFEHHYKAYGFWAPAVGDYQAFKIMDWSGSEEYRSLMKIEEPYEYRDRLTMPKFIINSTGDQFFLPDSWQFYYQNLKGTKYLRYVPNTDHGLKNSDAAETLMACYDAIIHQKELPKFDWKISRDGTIKVKPETKPTEVKLWQAHNPKARDFRLETLGPAWKSSSLQPDKDGNYSATVDEPASGWTAYMVELTFKKEGSPVPFKFTTGVTVLPKKLPHTFAKPQKPVSNEKEKDKQSAAK
jgi:PhoPQ-activated pathogenicity-related protein